MGWCWGAFGLTWIWGIANRTGLTLLFLPATVLMPSVGPLILSIWFGVMGHEWAWRNRRFAGFAQFQETMRVWNMWGMVFTVLTLLPLVIVSLFFVWIVVGTTTHGFR